MERCATLGAIEAQILSSGSLWYSSSWVNVAVTTVNTLLPAAFISYVAGRSPRSMNEGTRLSLAGVFMLVLMLTAYVAATSADLGAPHVRPHADIRRGGRRHHFRKALIEDMVEDQPFRLRRIGSHTDDRCAHRW